MLYDKIKNDSKYQKALDKAPKELREQIENIVKKVIKLFEVDITNVQIDNEKNKK